MIISKTQQCGNVVLKEIQCDRSVRPCYSDGKREGQLLDKLLQSDSIGNDQWMREKAEKDFVFEYHLSPIRHNLLKWFPFVSSSSLLDIGCGCGAMTRLFAEKVAKVTALEYSSRRAQITALRHRNLRNLDVFIGGLQDFTPEERYNYVSMIGVLEYAPTFFGGVDAQAGFLRRAAGLLAPDGALIIAIENKIGLKYLGGAPEDHTGRVFDSLYDYPFSKGVRTLSKKELSELLQSVGFNDLEWFYPFPDYKLPRIVFSDHVTPQDVDRVWEACKSNNDHHQREIISAKLLGRTLTRAGLFHEFANSFLVIARRDHTLRKTVRCLKFTAGTLIRKPQFQLDSMLIEKDGVRSLVKSPAGCEAAQFPQIIANREQSAVQYFGSAAKVVTGTLEKDGICYPFLPCSTLEDLVVERLRLGAVKEADALLNEYCEFLRRLPSSRANPEGFLKAFGLSTKDVRGELVCLNAGPIDLVPANIIVAPDGWHLLDHEWFFDFAAPVDFIIYRGIATLVRNAQDFIQSNASANPVVLLAGYGRKRTYMPVSWLTIFDNCEISLKRMSYWNWRFQAQVLQCDTPHRTRLRRNPRVLHDTASLSEKITRSLRWRIDKARFVRNLLIGQLSKSVNKLLLHCKG